MRWLISGVVLVVILAGALLAFGIYISPKDPLSRSDVVVAVSGGDTYARTMEAVRLYKNDWVSHMIFSGSALDPDSESNAAAMREIAINAGVSPEAITVEEESDNTRQNADRTAALIRALEYESMILVTSPYHQRRTYIEFKNQLARDVTIINHPAPDDRWSRRTWWRSPFGWYITASEAPKVLYSLSQS
jgi:uncharacterized SAM-binding protein YcdF (DUF218 family)